MKINFPCFLLLHFSAFCQHVSDAYQHQIIRQECEFPVEFVNKGGFTQLTVTVFGSAGNELDQGTVTRQVFFSSAGLPLRDVNRKTWISDSSIVTYQYDSLYRLVEKITKKRSEDYPYPLRDFEIKKWQYAHDLSTNHQHWVTSRNNNYNQVTVVAVRDSLVFSDKRNQLYRYDLLRPRQNGMMDESKLPDSVPAEIWTWNPRLGWIEKTHYRPMMTNRNPLDSVGNVLINNDFQREIDTLLGKRVVLPDNIRGMTQIARKENQGDTLITFYFGPIYRLNVLEKEFIDSTNFVAVNLKQKSIDVQLNTSGMHIYQDGDAHWYNRKVEHYSLDFRLIYAENYYSMIRQSMFADQFEAQKPRGLNSLNKLHLPEILTVEQRQYTPEGLLSVVTLSDANGKITQKRIYTWN